MNGLRTLWHKPFTLMVARVCILGLVLQLVACGFHLREAYQLPAIMKVTYLKVASDNTELVRSLKRHLRANDIKLVSDESQASAVLHLFGEAQSKRVISVDSRGRAREYALTYQISFRLAKDKDNLLIKQQTLSLQRDFLFDTEDVLGKGREEATLISDMQQDMVRLIMLRLQAAGQALNASNQSAPQE